MPRSQALIVVSLGLVLVVVSLAVLVSFELKGLNSARAVSLCEKDSPVLLKRACLHA
jgi:hypothetical protein